MIKSAQDLTADNNSRREELQTKLDELLLGLTKQKNIRSAVAAVESADGSFRWQGAVKETRPGQIARGDNSPFWITSVTKLFIAAAILKLHEQRQLTIENPVVQYLPCNLTVGLHLNKAGTDKTDSITIRHLLSHTSGLPEYIEIRAKDGKNLYESILEKGDRSWSIAESLQIVKNHKKPLFDPQSLDQAKVRSRYSDTNFQLLIAVIESVSGKPFNDVFKEMFYRPLSLQNTYLPGSTPLDPATPEAMPVWAGTKELHIPGAMRSFGDLFSTTADLLVFMRALVGGILFQNPHTAEMMRSNWNRFGFMISPVAPGWPIEYGLGMMRFAFPRFVTPFKALPAVIGHTGASGTWLFYCPEESVYMVGSVNQLEGAAVPFRLVPKILRLLAKP